MADDKPLTAYQQALMKSKAPVTEDSILAICTPEQKQRLLGYMVSIENLSFGKVTSGVWQTIRDEGLGKEKKVRRPADWLVGELSLAEQDIAGLKAMDDSTVDLFNTFDILLKLRFGGETVDLIDYDIGRIRLVRTVSKPAPSSIPAL